jgi:hypothetical protein
MLLRTDPELPVARVEKMESVIEVSMKITADHVVALLSTVAAPRGPKAVWLPIPPKAAAMSALLPLCSSTTMIKNKQTTMWMMVTSTIISNHFRRKTAPFQILPKYREYFIWCGRGDLNPHAFWAPPPQDGVSASSTTSAKPRWAG